MARFRINGISGDLFEGRTGRTALFCNGLPGAIGPLPGVLLATGHGWSVLFPQYPGTYDSDGDFSVSATAQALDDVLIAVETGQLRTWSGQPIVGLRPVKLAIAHSFGALVLAECLRRRPSLEIERILLLAPVVSYASSSGVSESLSEHVEIVRQSRPRTYRFGDRAEWNAVASGQFLGSPRRRPAGQVLAVFGTEDDTFDIATIRTTFPTTIAEAINPAGIDILVVPGAGHAMNELIEGQAQVGAFVNANA